MCKTEWPLHSLVIAMVCLRTARVRPGPLLAYRHDMQICPPQRMRGSLSDHALLMHNEQHYSKDPYRLAEQLAEDQLLIADAILLWNEQRNAGAGRLLGRQQLGALEGAPFLDGHVYGLPGDHRARELIVLGDLHGCYSCLKAALLQSDFFLKVDRHRKDPHNQPDVKFVLLGDYIDRGRFSYDGVLRAVLQLFVSLPEYVYVLRGNHEHYIDMGDRVVGTVLNGEALETFQYHLPRQMFDVFRACFEAMPNMLVAGRTLYVHAGIPRDATLAAKWQDCSSLNDPDLRFEMMWSDPADDEWISTAVQRTNVRFPFGRQQFRNFMQRIGCDVLVRGHGKVDEGFKIVYGGDDGGPRLLNLFSAGGPFNADLPRAANYRSVRPMALSIVEQAGGPICVPWEIDYLPFNHPSYNGFMRQPAEIEFRSAP